MKFSQGSKGSNERDSKQEGRAQWEEHAQNTTDTCMKFKNNEKISCMKRSHSFVREMPMPTA